MKKILLILFVCLPATVGAITGPASRFDFTQGQPSITADNATVCNDTATVRFDFVSGQPAEVFDSTANCTAAAASSGEPLIIWFDE